MAWWTPVGSDAGIYSGNLVSNSPRRLSRRHALASAVKNCTACRLPDPGTNTIGLSVVSDRNRLSPGSDSLISLSPYSGKPVRTEWLDQSGWGDAYHCGNRPITRCGECHQLLTMWRTAGKSSSFRRALAPGDDARSAAQSATRIARRLNAIGQRLIEASHRCSTAVS